MRISNIRIGVIFTIGLTITGCGTVDPWSLLPASERIAIEMSPPAATERTPITVAELLRRTFVNEEVPSNLSGETNALPAAADLFFAVTKYGVAVDLNGEQFELLAPFKRSLQTYPETIVVIEVPATSAVETITGYRRAAAVARYLEASGKRVTVRPAADLVPDTVRVVLERGA